MSMTKEIDIRRMEEIDFERATADSGYRRAVISYLKELIRRFSVEEQARPVAQAALTEPNWNNREPTDFIEGSLVLRCDIGRAFWCDRQVNLTFTEFNIVRLLAERCGQDIPYRRIYDLVHGPGFVAGVGEQGFRANVRTLIKRIRKKFRTVDTHFDAIHNYPGFGYRWVAEDADTYDEDEKKWGRLSAPS